MKWGHKKEKDFNDHEMFYNLPENSQQYFHENMYPLSMSIKHTVPRIFYTGIKEASFMMLIDINPIIKYSWESKLR